MNYYNVKTMNSKKAAGYAAFFFLQLIHSGQRIYKTLSICAKDYFDSNVYN